MSEPNLHDDDAFDAVFASFRAEADRGVRAPVGFDSRLFTRIEREVRRRAAAPVADPLPWWARAARQPATVLAFVLAGFIAAWPAFFDEAPALATKALAPLAAWYANAVAAWLAPIASAMPARPAGLDTASLVALTLLPAVLYLSFELARGAEAWARRIHV